MKKLLLGLTIGLLLISCSSSDDNNTDNNVYFNFTINNKNYSSNDFVQGDLCWQALISQNNSKVDILMSFTDPSDNLTYCGVYLNGINNSIGTTNGCDFGLANGNETVSSNPDCTVELTEVGNFYEGTFNGNFTIAQGITFTTRSGSGSFRVPKEQ
jgi:hypothetical protein